MNRLFVPSIVVAFFSAAVLHGADFTGKWEAAVTMPDGLPMKVAYTITEAAGVFAGTVHTSEYGDFPMANLRIEGDTIIFDVSTDDGGYAHKGTLGRDGLTMQVVAPQGPMEPFVCKRPAADVTGTWRGRLQGPDGESDLLFTLEMKDGRLSGTVKGPLGEAQLINTSVAGDRVAFDSNYQGTIVKRTGRVEGDTMHLVIKVEGYEMPVTLKRDPKPAPPAPAAAKVD